MQSLTYHEGYLMHFVGIDVGAKELFLQVIRAGKPGKIAQFSNTPQGHKQIIKYLNPKKHQYKVCLEATGVYHFDLAVTLAKSVNIKVMVVNPKASNSFAEALMGREKSDLKDTTTLALFAERMDFVCWTPPEEDMLQLRAFARRLDALTQMKATAKNQLHALTQSEYTPKEVVKSQNKQVKFFEKEIALLEEKALELIDSNAAIKQQYALITSIKGFAKTSAIQLLGELAVMPSNLTNKQWVAMAGLDPRKHQSGTSVNKKAFISKAGNRRLRKALYMPALSAKKHEQHIRAYFNYLVEVRGLKKMQALCAVMRKLLHALHGMLNNNQIFDGSRFFAKYHEYESLAVDEKQA